jgi:hypothetical protein
LGVPLTEKEKHHEEMFVSGDERALRSPMKLREKKLKGSCSALRLKPAFPTGCRHQVSRARSALRQNQISRYITEITEDHFVVADAKTGATAPIA